MAPAPSRVQRHSPHPREDSQRLSTQRIDHTQHTLEWPRGSSQIRRVEAQHQGLDGGYQAPLIFCHMSHFQEPAPRRYSIAERSFRMAWNRLSLRTILRVANLILVVTLYQEQAKLKMGVPKNRILLFPGGIDDVSFSQFSSSDPQVFLKTTRNPNRRKIVAFLGTIENRKNPAVIAEVGRG